MRAAIIIRDTDLQLARARAFLAGLERHGDTGGIHDMHQAHTAIIEADFGVCWGKRNLDKLKTQSEGQDFVVMELGYMLDRLEWTSLGWNGLNGRAAFPLGDASRWRRYFADLITGDWKEGGEYVLVAAQVPGDAAVDAVNIDAWAEKAVARHVELGNIASLRPHPLVTAPDLDLGEDLAGAYLAVTYNSNLGVDAVLAGVPTVAMDEGSMAWPVASHVVSEVVKPPRNKWAQAMAWTQWTLPEIASGEAWAALREARGGRPFHELEA